jgi:predicted molibdopterin-dependent oxidoreductase YjgC
MPNMINLTIDGQDTSVPEGTTILKAAEAIGIEIPTICFHDYCTANALCRICVVEVDGSRTLTPACVGQVSQGMNVHTTSDRIVRVRRTILEMLHASVDLSDAPDILQMMNDYQVDRQRFNGSVRREPEVQDDNPMYVRDYAKCILCWRCVQVCATDAQFAYAINFSGRGYETQISTFYEIPMPLSTCVFCGQCVGVCPTGALKPKRQWLLELGSSPDEIMSLTRTERQSRRRADTSV